MVARGAGAAGPVLLACRQWDPLRLARRPPSRGAGAWRDAPLLPWRVQCPGRVCAALAAGSRVLGPVLGFVSSPFPPSRPAFPALCVAGRRVRVSLILAPLYAIPCGLCILRARSGCPSGIPRVSFACACAHALAASAPSPLPGSAWRAHLARSRGWAPVGPFHAVFSPPHVLPWSCAPFGLLWGGGGPVPPLPGLGLCALLWGTPQRALLRAGFARCGGGTRAPRGGAPLACVWGHRGRALSHPRPLILWGVPPGPTTHWLLVRGVWAWGPVTHPTARALPSWLCALWGRHEGARGRAPLACVWGVRGPALSHPRALVLWGVLSGPTTRWLWMRGVRAWRPVTNPTARTAACWVCALWGRHEGAQGGRLLPGDGASGVGRSANPDRSSFRACIRGPLPTGCVCEGAGVGPRHQTHNTRSCELALHAVGPA